MTAKAFVVACGFLVFGFAALAFAQDKTDVLRERNVAATGAAIGFQDDGGCELSGVGVARYDGGMTLQVSSSAFEFNGARCATLRTAAKRAINRELGVGDGGVP